MQQTAPINCRREGWKALSAPVLGRRCFAKLDSGSLAWDDVAHAPLRSAPLCSAPLAKKSRDRRRALGPVVALGPLRARPGPGPGLAWHPGQAWVPPPF